MVADTKPKPKTTTSRVCITEQLEPHGWLSVWTNGESQYHESAIAALRAVQARDKQLVESGYGAAVTFIEWEPKTPIGLTVVNVLRGR
jgi:hypothetical protein